MVKKITISEEDEFDGSNEDVSISDVYDNESELEGDDAMDVEPLPATIPGSTRSHLREKLSNFKPRITSKAIHRVNSKTDQKPVNKITATPHSFDTKNSDTAKDTTKEKAIYITKASYYPLVPRIILLAIFSILTTLTAPIAISDFFKFFKIDGANLGVSSSLPRFWHLTARITAPVFILLTIISLVLLIFTIIRIRRTRLAITDKFIRGRTGIFQTTETACPLSKLDGIQIHQSITGKIFSYATIQVIAQSAQFSFPFITEPKDFQRIFNEEIEIYETKQARKIAEYMR